MTVDKAAVYQEYITSTISLRALSRKYDIPMSTLHGWYARGGWSVQKKEFMQQASAMAAERKRTEQEQILDTLSDRAYRVLTCTDKLIDRVEQVLALEDALAPRDLKSISSVLLDIQTIKYQAEDKQQDTTEWRVVLEEREWHNASD